MKQFETHPLYKKILQEEISRAKLLMFEYNEKEIWNTLTVNQREDALLSVDDDMGPDFADEYSEAEWLEIPDTITNRIDLRSYKQNDYVGAAKRSANTYQRGIYNIITDTTRFSNTKEMQEYVAKIVGSSASDLATLKTALANYANINSGKMMQFNIDVQRMSKGPDTGSSNPNDLNIASWIDADRKKNPNWNYD
tara:strand:- start:4086 stop:4670 length:585 start_codon:yes stop_codon:yes gene_type:complete